MRTVPPAPEGAKLRLLPSLPLEPEPPEEHVPGRPPADLESLKIRCFHDGYKIEALEQVEPVELFAIALDLGENDPAHSMITAAADGLVVLRLALASGEGTPNEATVERVMCRTENMLRVAAELHKRQRAIGRLVRA